MVPTSSSGACFKFWVAFSGPTSIRTLDAFVSSNGSNSKLWSLSNTISGTPGGQWGQAQFGVVSTENYQVVLQVTRTNSGSGYIVVDDVSFSSGTCQTTPPDAMTGTVLTTATPGTTIAPATQAPSQYDCTFESGTCSWTQAKDDQFDWTRAHGGTSTAKTGPSVDHTLGSRNGYYVYIEASSPRRLNDTARLVSAQITVTTTKCLHFWYHMYGTHVNTLNVYARVGSKYGAPLWTKTGTQNNQWYNANVNVKATSAYNIVFEGVRGTSYRGDIGLDDISVTDGPCNGNVGGVCTFEDAKICGYQQDQQDDFDWTRKSGRTTSSRSRPPNDHTYDTSKGSYEYIESSAPRRKGQKARLFSPANPATTGSCVQFWYHMYGATMGTLNVYTRIGNRLGTPVFTLSGDHGNSWYLAQVTVTAVSSWQVAFEGIVGGFQGDIAIDDVSITTRACSGNQGSCTFEKDLCTWYNVQTGDNFDWLRKQGSNSTTGTGPRSDPTVGSLLGHYVYIETSLPRVKGDQAWLLSPKFNPSTTVQCMSFWYHMYGVGVGTLNVRLFPPVGGDQLLWSQTGNQGSAWLQGQLPVPKTASIYAIRIDGNRGSTYTGDIAIDDISFTPSNCGLSKSNYDCSFEQGLCTWTQDASDNFNWTRAQGPTGTTMTRPIDDHTLKTSKGGYMYVKTSSPRKPNDKARLITASVPARNAYCLTLWYHMYGPHVNALNVYFKKSGQLGGAVWAKLGTQGNQWKHGQLSVPAQVSTFNIVLEGVVGSGYRGDIGLDDIRLACPTSNGTIEDAPTSPSTTVGTCSPGTLKCKTRNTCFSYQKQCDFIDDCGDNSDELVCGTTCDFETGTMCGWMNSARDNTDFTVVTAAQSAGPKVDHTKATNQGKYLLVQNGVTSTQGDVAILESSIYFSSSPACNFSFSYNTNGVQYTNIKVLLKTSQGQTLTLWSKMSDINPGWQQQTVNIGAYNKFSLVLMVAFSIMPGQRLVGFDDLKFSQCAPVAEVKSCPLNKWLCANHQMCIPLNQRCDHRADCNDGTDEYNCIPNLGDCNFDDPNWLSLCKWSQRQDDDADWTQAHASTSPQTGPPADHQGTQNSQYLVIDSSYMKTGDVTDVMGPQFPASHGVCYVRFFYYMYGSANIGPLRVYTYNTNGEKNLMWSASGSKGQKWFYANVLVGDNNKFSVVFEGQAGDRGTSDIAIDDVTFTRECSTGLPPALPTGPVCNPQKEFLCKPRMECLPNTWICDGTVDCADMTDEPNTCPTTTVPTRPSLASGLTYPPTPPRTTHAPKTKPSTTTKVVVTLPATSSCGVGQFQCAVSNCLPRIYRCDGVPDCPQGSDEVGCKKCRPDFLFCAKQNLCITNATRCDGMDDCGDGTDESLCSVTATCGPSFCQNGGSCIPGKTPPLCSCPSAYTGPRCQYSAPGAQQQTSQPAKSGWKVGVGVTVGVVGLVLIAAGVFLGLKKYKPDINLPNLPSFRRSRSSQGGLTNPVNDGAYGSEGNTEFQMGDIDSGFQSSSIKNPLYSKA